MSGLEIFLFTQIKCAKNSVQYQRAKYATENHDVCFLTRRGVCDDIAADAVRVEQSGESLLYRFLFPFWLAWGVWKISRQHDVSRVHTNHSPQTLLAGFILQQVGFVWVADIYDSPHITLDLTEEATGYGRVAANWYNRTLVRVAEYALSQADLVVVAMVPDILDRYGVKPDDENVFPVTNGVSLELTRNDRTEAEPDSFTLVYVGPVGRVRALDVVFDALRLLEGTVSDVDLRLVGGVRDETWLQDATPELDGVDITATGRVPHTEALAEIDRGDAGLCPLSISVENYRAAYPIKIFEYMAMGVPPIATRTDGTATILDDGETGLLVPPDDAEAMADAIERLYDDPDDRARIGTNAASAVEDYDWDSINRRIWERIDAVR